MKWFSNRHHCCNSEIGFNLQLYTNVTGYEQYQSQHLTRPIFVFFAMFDGIRLQEGRLVPPSSMQLMAIVFLAIVMMMLHLLLRGP
jgi:hypothetical protein